jgi:hypothetical protein
LHYRTSNYVARDAEAILFRGGRNGNRSGCIVHLSILSHCEPPNREARLFVLLMKLSMKGAQAHSDISLAYIDIKVNTCQIGQISSH